MHFCDMRRDSRAKSRNRNLKVLLTTFPWLGVPSRPCRRSACVPEFVAAGFSTMTAAGAAALTATGLHALFCVHVCKWHAWTHCLTARAVRERSILARPNAQTSLTWRPQLHAASLPCGFAVNRRRRRFARRQRRQRGADQWRPGATPRSKTCSPRATTLAKKCRNGWNSTKGCVTWASRRAAHSKSPRWARRCCSQRNPQASRANSSGGSWSNGSLAARAILNLSGARMSYKKMI